MNNSTACILGLKQERVKNLGEKFLWKAVNWWIAG
jgi:hypothetical protein